MPFHDDAEPPWRPRARSDLVFRRVGEDWVLFDEDGQRLHVLNLAAALVWSHCTGELDLGEIEDSVADAYGEAVESPGVSEVLDEFRAAGLLAE